MKKAVNWKDTYRAGIYASLNLRKHKVHRDLLSYLINSANQKVKFCWPTQQELATVCDCSVRHVYGLLDYLHEIGAIYPVRYSDLPKSTQGLVKALTPNKVTRNANAYYLCLDWAKDVLAGDEEVPLDRNLPELSNLTADSRRRGSMKSNARRQRYRPIDAAIDLPVPTSPEHDDWQIINAVPAETGSPTSSLNRPETGSGATDMTTEYNPAAISVPNNATGGSFGIPPSKAESAAAVISSLPSHPVETSQHGYGGGEASAPVPSLEGLARPEGTEQDAAGARANERRVS